MAESSRVLVEAIKKDPETARHHHQKSIENAVALIMATGGSTNAVLHYLAITTPPASTGRSTTSSACARRYRCFVILKPSGQYVMTDLHAVGGVPQVLKLLLNKGLLHGDCMTITGRTMAEELAKVPDLPRKDQDVIRQPDNPLYAQGHLAILKGNLAPEGCVAKITGLKTR